MTDHGSVDDGRGGAPALARLAARAGHLHLGVLVDIVPNHVGVASARANAWWWDLLGHGRGSRFADAFDVDWDAGGGRIRLPVLGDGDDELDRLEVDGDLLRYHDQVFPIAPGTAGPGDDGRAVHARQHYELVGWRRADSELNYRRFFGVNTLAAIRVEVPWVFAESHREIGRWVREGLVDGIRVDHPDGLADPGGYLDDLAAITGGVPVWVEKILEGREQLPPNWATAGTTGYDALAEIDRLFVDPSARRTLERADAGLDGDAAERPSWETLIHGTKRAIADGILRSEVLRLARLLPGIDGADDAIAELAACFPVYRSYLPFGAEHLRAAAAAAVRHRPDLATAIEAVLPALADPEHPAAVRFQQTTGMVMAKGVEDTAFYRYSRLTSLNEVGADPGEFAVSVAEFHHRQAVRQAAYPASLTTLSTHDTKRGEDVRARISALSEFSHGWSEALPALHALAGFGDGPVEDLLWQAIVGAWPVSRERLHGYAEKAAREAATSTTWTSPSEAFETRLHAAVDAAFDDERVAEVIGSVVAAVRDAGYANGLSAKLVQLTAPGVPDVYQGSELWERSLVDPDNRRAVDFDLRRAMLRRIDDGWLPPIDESGAAKLLVTARALRLRRRHPERFSRYLGIPAYGSAAHHVIAFDRGDAVTVATRLPMGLARHGGWRDTSVAIPRRAVVDVITGRRYAGGSLAVGDVLADYPVALLTPEEAS